MEGDFTRVILITANVGSIFEEPETMFPLWLKAFFQCIQSHKPGLVALHCQEVGGKNYEASMQHVNHFIKTLLACQELHRYDRARIFLDEDYTASDKFTALGNLYFIHEDVTDVSIWDFVDCKFVEVEGREVLSGSIENIPIKEKAKFPQYFFPEFKWSRKGFLRTRWSINSCIFDLVNIHLFHDASNIVAMETSPSVYLENRQRALLHTLQRFENDSYITVPLFIFGDFNFRLDSNVLIQELAGKLVASQTKSKKGQVNKVEYTDLDTGKIVLTVGSKSFDYYDRHSDLFATVNKWLHQYDTEFSSFQDRLFEYDISFPPSYPFCEDATDGFSYMKTRVPSWCDRVLLTHSAKDIISQDNPPTANSEDLGIHIDQKDPSHQVIYDLIGQDVCMGDHKPAYLFLHLKPGKGNCEQQKPSSFSSTTKFMPPRKRKHSLSINGQIIEGLDFRSADLDLTVINIHDYASFENENNLMPDFKTSIKERKTTDEELCSENDIQLMSSQQMVTRNRSFQDIAREVVKLEKILLQWPKRPQSRHHSSSSEDFPSDDGNGDDIDIFKAESSYKQNMCAVADCSSNDVIECMKDMDSQKEYIINETNNNKSSEDSAQENSQIKHHSNSSDLDSRVTVETNIERGQGLDKVGAALAEVGQSVGCGDGDRGVVLLAQHGGHMHVDSPVSSVPQLASQSYQGEPQSGKTGKAMSAPSSPPSGCCSCRCVVL